MKANLILTVITTLILEGTSTVIVVQTEPGMTVREVKSLTDLVRLPCNISEADSYRWSRYFAALPSNGFESKDHSLVIDQVLYKDSGLYGCTGCNDSSCESFNVTLEVLHTISEQSMLNETVLVDGEVEFYCGLKVEPSFSYKVEFYKYAVIDRHDLKFLSNLTKLDTNGTRSLKLDNAKFENSGWYSCVINHLEFFNFDNSEAFYKINNYVAFKRAYLEVLERPKLFEMNQPQPMTTPTVIGILFGVFIFLVLLAAYTYKQIKQKKICYQSWFKTLSTTRSPIDTDSETFQMSSSGTLEPKDPL